MRAAVQRALGAPPARNFPTGSNTAVGRWRAPHTALGRVGRLGDEERDVADEGVGMFARIADLATAGRAPGHAQ